MLPQQSSKCCCCCILYRSVMLLFTVLFIVTIFEKAAFIPRQWLIEEANKMLLYLSTITNYESKS